MLFERAEGRCRIRRDPKVERGGREIFNVEIEERIKCERRRWR